MPRGDGHVFRKWNADGLPGHVLYPVVFEIPATLLLHGDQPSRTVRVRVIGRQFPRVLSGEHDCETSAGRSDDARAIRCPIRGIPAEKR
jgi:hypothetical protein